MHIQLNFDNLDELDTWMQWAHSRNRTDVLTVKMDASEIRRAIDETLVDLRREDVRPITAEGAVIPGDTETVCWPTCAIAGEAPSTEPAPEDKPKRKRRTKAEIAADEAAANVVQVPVDVQPAAATELTKLNQAADNARGFAAAVTAGVSADIAALAATIDGSDKMAHMNEGRDFIAKHGFPKYNETFALADVPANIAAHTPEQAALHRAAMQWLIAQSKVA